MLSVIICSINPDYLLDVKRSISSTIGVDFELIIWDNRIEKRGLCEVYNLTASKAKYPYCCFIHEDIVFQTQGWGYLLIEAFTKDNSIGLIGIAGSRYKSAMYSGWHTGIEEFDSFNIIHKIDGVDHVLKSSFAGENSIREVICIDGVLMACRKEVWEDIRFDDNKIKGFHFYDIDFSYRTSEKYKVITLLNIDLEHITQGGDYGNSWIISAIEYHKRLGNSLPRALGLIIEKYRYYEIKIAKLWLDRLKNENISPPNKFRWIISQKLLGYPELYYSIIKFLLYKPMRLKKIHFFLKRFKANWNLND